MSTQEQGSERGVREAEGLRVAATSALADRLITDFSVVDRGFRQLAAIRDERERASVSDEACQAVLAVGANLMEARLHEKDLAALVGAGLPLPATGSPPAHYESQARVDQHLAGFFRACGSTVDCLAAAAIGLLLAPRGIRRASYLDLLALDDDRAEPTDAQRATWRGLQTKANDHRHRQPEGWFDWAMEARNAIVHRGRPLSLMLPAPREDAVAGLTIETDDPYGVAVAISRGTPHLRRRPWVGDLQDLGQSATINAIWLEEPALLTLMGLREHLNDLVEDLAGSLLSLWQELSSGALELRRVSARRRRSADVPESLRESFGGFAPPARVSVSFGAFHPHAANRVRLAQELWGVDA